MTPSSDRPISRPGQQEPERVELSEGRGEKGIQIIQTTGLPPDFTPPTMSVTAYDAKDDQADD